VAVGNDVQFDAFSRVLGIPELASDERFRTNPLRAQNRLVLVPVLAKQLARHTVGYWHDAFEAAGVPSGPINGFAEVFSDPQIIHREMRMEMNHTATGTVPQVANPVKFSATPVQYHRAPPLLGEHTEEVLRERLSLSNERMAELRQEKVI
jgi:crotonobetainyl-CoA:carnitine CoA-transferase CaiB-like acyl-CoA transferase